MGLSEAWTLLPAAGACVRSQETEALLCTYGV